MCPKSVESSLMRNWQKILIITLLLLHYYFRIRKMRSNTRIMCLTLIPAWPRNNRNRIVSIFLNGLTNFSFRELKLERRQALPRSRGAAWGPCCWRCCWPSHCLQVLPLTITFFDGLPSSIIKYLMHFKASLTLKQKHWTAYQN